jgi:nucleoside phosphorylase
VTNTDPEATIGILTALAIECAAVRATVTDLRRIPVSGDPNQYFTATLPSADPSHPHGLIITVLPQDGTRSASAVCSGMIRSFPSIRCIVTCGIAGGVPVPTVPHRHVRLGDIVVATRGIVDYSHVRTIDGADEVRRQVQGLSSDLSRAAIELQIKEYGGQRPWEAFLDTDKAFLRSYKRPPDAHDVVYRDGEPVAHPARRRSGHPRGLPKVHYAAIASGDRLLRDEALRDTIASRYGVAAIEMEASGVAVAAELHSRHWFVVRGVSDYCDNVGKNDLWHPNASLAAAAYVRALLAECNPLWTDGAAGTATAAMALPAGTGAAVATRPNPHVLLHIADVLLDIPAVHDDHRRAMLVRLVETELDTAIRGGPGPVLDVLDLLTTCFDHPGGVATLLTAIRRVAGDSRPVDRAEEALRPFR